ncbi:hypothetical protein [Novipirellula caenicola]|uniref:Tetratricopeptide repeat protein n=1 Tax=Novipirellula caenicola TaxID=1536901 RepID=A0ABP9W1N5_9BACT
MAIDAELDALYSDAERLLDDESVADDDHVKRTLVDTAIEKATELVHRSPDNPDFHHLLGLAWYHHPDKTDARLDQIRSAFQRALSLDPQHQFANQYLGYINFDVADYADAYERFASTNHEFFFSIDQKWRSLKATELAFVCQLRLGRDIDLDKLNQFFAFYLAEEREQVPNTVIPIELRRCAEWLFDQTGNVDDEPLRSIVDFLHASGDLQLSGHAGLKAAR